MGNPVFQTLRHQVETFKQWATGLTGQYGEWETEYLYWDSLYNAVEEVLGLTPSDEWDTEVFELILYILARDNEVENVLQMLVEQPKVLLPLAHNALLYTDNEAKWQIAYGLGEIKEWIRKLINFCPSFWKMKMSMLEEGLH
jgi:hypothetical protein